MVFVLGCTAEVATIPSVATNTASAITSTSATIDGAIIDDGGASITARGFVWNTSFNPTIGLSNKTTDGTGTGFFSSTILGLNTTTRYSVRAYATNKVGTAYGTEINFSTLAGIPSVTTNLITDIAPDSAMGGFYITSDGGSGIINRGLVWGISKNPTIDLTTKTNISRYLNDNGTGSFISTISGLFAGTTYFVRAYATNSIGTAYGVEVHFTTTAPAVSPLVTIGTQNWADKNLDVATYSDGTIIPQVTDQAAWTTLSTGAWCYYNNDPSNGDTYGKLYNWYAVAGIWNDLSKTDTSQRKKLAPTGYHIPTGIEWAKLSNYLGGAVVAGGKMKATTIWNSPNQDATNSSGFTGLPGGCRDGIGAFVGNRISGIWWSSSEADATSANNIYLHYLFKSIGATYPSKKYGVSVRCVKD